MVGVAQLVELRIVIPAVGGSSPLVHPISSKELYLTAFLLINTSWRFRECLCLAEGAYRCRKPDY